MTLAIIELLGTGIRVVVLMGNFDKWNSLASCVEDFRCFGVHGSRHPQGESGWKEEVDRHLSLEVVLTVDK